MNTPVRDPRIVEGLTPATTTKITFINHEKLQFSIFVRTCVNDGLVGELEEHPQLRVHDVRLLGVHAEEGGVELVELLDFAGPSGQTVQPRGPSALVVGDEVDAGEQLLPELVDVGRLGQARRQTGDDHLLAGGPGGVQGDGGVHLGGHHLHQRRLDQGRLLVRHFGKSGWHFVLWLFCVTVF